MKVSTGSIREKGREVSDWLCTNGTRSLGDNHTPREPEAVIMKRDKAGRRYKREAEVECKKSKDVINRRLGIG